SHYDDIRPGEVGQRQNGVLISNGQGKAVAFALFGLQDRGKLFWRNRAIGAYQVTHGIDNVAINDINRGYLYDPALQPAGFRVYNP
ncbi:hypothetical protein MJL33_29470, partial [Salmonella enterica subsp. enterica serovar Kentucky]|nr:hypothetical protein [Salmonella enterica subsp. enterica serovar Kentucky]